MKHFLGHALVQYVIYRRFIYSILEYTVLFSVDTLTVKKMHVVYNSIPRSASFLDYIPPD